MQLFHFFITIPLPPHLLATRPGVRQCGSVFAIKIRTTVSTEFMNLTETHINFIALFCLVVDVLGFFLSFFFKERRFVLKVRK